MKLLARKFAVELLGRDISEKFELVDELFSMPTIRAHNLHKQEQPLQLKPNDNFLQGIEKHKTK